MTDPLRLLGEAPEGAALPGLPRNAQARWLQELERAQLARQARAAMQTNSQAAQQDVAERHRAPPRGEPAVTPQRHEGSRQEQRRFQDFVSNMRASSPHAEPHARPAGGSQGGGEARIAREPVTRGTPLPAPRPAAKPVPVTWPRVNVHAHWNGAGVEVWVRDATLDAQARQRLAARLRRELQGLESLTVNGETIYQEEQDPWPSKR